MQSTKWVHEALWVRSRSFIDLGPNLSDSIILNFFSSIATRPIEAKLHVEPPWDWRTKAYSNGSGHMTKMAAMPIYDKNFKNLLFWNLKADGLETLCSIKYPCVDLDLFYAKADLVPYAFVWEEGKIMDFSETFVVYDITVGRCSQLRWVHEVLWVPKVKVKLLFLNNPWF